MCVCVSTPRQNNNRAGICAANRRVVLSAGLLSEPVTNFTSHCCLGLLPAVRFQLRFSCAKSRGLGAVPRHGIGSQLFAGRAACRGGTLQRPGDVLSHHRFALLHPGEP